MVNRIFEILTDLEFRFRENSTLNDDQKFLKKCCINGISLRAHLVLGSVVEGALNLEKWP